MEEKRMPDELGFSSFKSYVYGFIASLLLTLGAYALAPHKWTYVIAALGTAQALIQFFLFLNLHNESKPRWNLMLFLFTVMVTLIIVFGSIWIMNNLNYNLMSMK